MGTLLKSAALPVLLIAILVAALHYALNLSPARGLGLLLLAQMSTILSLGLFSREANIVTSESGMLALASLLCFQVLPDHLPQPISIFCALSVGFLSYYRLVRHPRLPLGSIVGKLVVVTGSSAGIGAETATQLLSLGATVVFACRSEARARAAMRSALASAAERAAPGVAVTAEAAVFVPLDLSSCASVVACADAVRELAISRRTAEVDGARARSRACLQRGPSTRRER